MRLSKCAQGRDNNFNLIRLVAALAVLYSHSFALVSGSDKAEPLRQTLGMTLGTMAVDVFFITSGFLVTASLLTKQDIGDFIRARLLRIYPALLVMVALAVLVLGLCFTSLPPGEFLSSPRTANFALKNSTLIFGVAYSLPGVFETLPWKSAVNGSLWTMPVEIRMYAILAFLWLASGFFGSERARTAARLLLLLSVLAWAMHFADRFYLRQGSDFLRLFFMFFSGATCWALRDRLVLSLPLGALLLAGVFVATLERDAFFVAYNLSLAYLVLCVAYIPDGPIRHFNRLGDYSYGVYIYAFPVQQSLVALFPGISVAQMVVVSAAATLTLAALSWHLLEKHALALKGKAARASRRALERA